MRNLVSSLLVSLLLVLGCEAPRSESEEARNETAARPDSTADDRVVVLRAGPLHLERDAKSPGVTEVAAGTLLRVVPDSADAAGDEWVRVATWDDRRGWMPASRLIEPKLWSHYGEALGGVSPILLRPGYPAEGGRWAVEAPFGSPGFTPASSGWLIGDSARGARIVAIDSLENICDGELHRFGLLDRPATADHFPFLEGGLLAAPSGRAPTTRWLPIGPLEPDPALVELARRTAEELGPGRAEPRLPLESIEWVALGESAWAALSWPVEDVVLGQAQLAAALIFRRTPEGWERVGTLAPTPSTAEIPTPAWRPVAAYATGGADHPTLLLLETFEYEGAHLDIWIERGDGFERIYEGYYWGC